MAVATVEPFPLLAASAVAAGVSATTAPSETRVRGIDSAGEASTWTSTLPSTESHWAWTYSYGELAADRQEVTNLRLPGQYDERLLGSVGLQGPYYSTNRWYLPGVGRYLELDPIALRGGMNGPHGPDWYNYAEGNPLTNTDFFGLDAELCTRRFNARFPPPYARHCFIRFNGDNGDTLSFDTGGVHPDPDPTKPGAQCTPTGGGDRDKCVKREMAKCKNYDFFGFNCCHCAEQALKACGIFVPPDRWPNWPINPGPQPGEPGYTPEPVFP